MTSARRNLFDPERLLQIAGEKAFKRGQGYADNGNIALLSVNDDGVLAVAFGTDDYTVWLNRSGPGILGHCTCPAFEDAGFCKHMVASALVANETIRRGDEPPDRIGEISRCIAGLGRSRLEKLLLEMTTADWRTLRSLGLALGCDWEDDFD